MVVIQYSVSLIEEGDWAILPLISIARTESHSFPFCMHLQSAERRGWVPEAKPLTEELVKLRRPREAPAKDFPQKIPDFGDIWTSKILYRTRVVTYSAPKKRILDFLRRILLSSAVCWLLACQS
jgi:hypothetical protein